MVWISYHKPNTIYQVSLEFPFYLRNHAESRTFSLKNHSVARGYFLMQTSRKDNESCLDGRANPSYNGDFPFSTPANAFFFTVDNSKNHSWIAKIKE